MEKRRTKKGKVEYLIKWQNFDKPEDNSWEPMSNIAGYKHLVEEFESKLLAEQKNEKNETPIENSQVRRVAREKDIQEPARQQETQKKEIAENSSRLRSPVAGVANKVKGGAHNPPRPI